MARANGRRRRANHRIVSALIFALRRSPHERLAVSWRDEFSIFSTRAERAAAFFLLSIFIVVCLQIAARWIGVSFPGAANYAGYALAAASFLALAPALNRGAHIRVGLLLQALPPARRKWGEAFCLGAAALVCALFAAAAARSVFLVGAAKRCLARPRRDAALDSAMRDGGGRDFAGRRLGRQFARVLRRGEWPGQSGDKAD